MGNLVKLDTSGLMRILEKIEALDGGATNREVEKLMQKANTTIATDTVSALAAPHLPAQGRYSSGDSERAVIRDAQTTWDGDVAWIPIGFDFTLPGAGGFLISGTPRMAPDMELRKMYRQKRYMSDLQKELLENLWDAYLRMMQ